MDSYQICASEIGWELRRSGSTEATKVMPSKEDMLGFLPRYMDGKTALVKIYGRNGSFECEQRYPQARM